MLYRARIVFVVAVVLAAIVLLTEFPVSSLVSARAASASAAAELSKVQSENKALASQVHDLKEGSTIEQVAHEEYGLVEPGQQSVVVMPGATSSTSTRGGASSRTNATAPLGSSTIPKSDLVPSDAPLSPVNEQQGAGTSATAASSFWKRVLERLEFWKPTA